MTTRRLSQLQRRILRCLAAESARTQGISSMGPFELVQTLGKEKSNISHSLRTLKARGFITIGRTAGGQADYLALTPEGRKWAAEIP